MSGSRVTPVLRRVVARISRTLDLGTREAAGEYRAASRTLDLGRREFSRADSFESEIAQTRTVVQAHPFSGRQWNYRRSDAESAMAARRLVEEVEFTGDMADDAAKSKSEVRKVRSDDGELNIYKPIRGEWRDRVQRYYASSGAQTTREIAAFRLDEMLGFGRIPPTARTPGMIGSDGKPAGPGMVQQFVESTQALELASYPRVQRQQIAVLDYIIGAEDRHYGNFRTVTGDDGHSIVAIDHGRSFPSSHGPFSVPIMSDFVAEQMGGKEPLDPSVLAAVKAVDPVRLTEALGEAGLDPLAIKGALARLAKLKEFGDIPKNTPLNLD